MSRFSKKLLTAGAQEEFTIENSLRFDKGSSPYLERAQIDGNQQVFTISFWLKRGEAISGTIFESSNLISFTDRDNVSINVLNDTISAGGQKRIGGATVFNHTVITDAILRDSNTWYHIVVAVDLTDATATDRIKIYVNNELQVLQTNSVGTDAMSINRAGVPFYVGRLGDVATNHHDGYLAEVHLVDGQRLTPSDFGEYNPDTGQWVAKRYTGSYGNNGFHLDFADETDLGKDASGNLSTADEIIFNHDMETGIPTFTTPSWVSQSATKAKSGTYSMRVAISTASGNTTASFGDTFYAEEGGVISLWWNTDNIDDDDANLAFSSSAGNGFIGIDPKRQNQSDIYYRKPTSTTTQSLLPTGVVPQNNVWFKFEYVFDSINYVFSIYNESGTVLFTETGPHYRQSYDQMYLSDADGHWRYYIDDIVVKQRDKRFVVRNLTADDQMLDTPTNNFSVLNTDALASTSEGNLKTTTNVTGSWQSVVNTIGVSSGKWYFETCAPQALSDPPYAFIGITTNPNFGQNTGNNYLGLTADSWGYLNNAKKYNNGSNAAYGSTYTLGDVIGCALDMDAGTVEFFKNNVSQGVAFTGLTGTMFCGASVYAGSGTTSNNINFGADSSFAGIKTRQNNSDANDKGDFYYTPPAGFLSICTDNLPAPTIQNPETQFNVVTYTGDGTSSNAITGVGFQPDFVWIKRRSATASHCLVDSVRGANLRLKSDVTTGDLNESVVKSFDNSGFTVSIGSGGQSATNSAGDSFVAWCWKAGGTAVTNTAGAITSQVSANVDAGFSVATYTGNSSTGTIGHGLSKKPELVIIKNRGTTSSWFVGSPSFGTNNYILLNSTSAMLNYVDGTGSFFEYGGWSDFVVNVYDANSTSINSSSYSYVMYSFHSVEGFSKFGSYEGNGSADGPFVNTGFEVAFVLLKNIDATANWVIVDNERNGYNQETKALYPNLTNVESISTPVELYSNGFKPINAGGTDFNVSGNTYIYMAFAKHPLKYANAR